jgi:hypothetical protein
VSFNIEASFELEEGGCTGWYTLTRAGVGITHSASIARDDTIWFRGKDINVGMKVVGIDHRYEKPGTAIAPVSVAVCNTEEPIPEREFLYIVEEYGFKLSAEKYGQPPAEERNV